MIGSMIGCLRNTTAVNMADSAVQYWFRLPGEKPGPGKSGQRPEEAVENKEETKEEKLILCRHCGHAVTHPDERTEKEGAYQHTFANPHGIVYDIGCFRTADGCGATGPATGEFTWFKGYRWRVAVCIACLVHIGWLFVSDSGDRFHGLILDRLVFPS